MKKMLGGKSVKNKKNNRIQHFKIVHFH